MAWIKLSDDYNDHPKIDNLSDGAFRLWHQVMGFCRKYQTDGLVPTTSLRKFKAYSPKRVNELQTPWREGAEPLWHTVDGFGIKVHGYLRWNPSKDEENERRSDSRDRMRQLREERQAVGVPPLVSIGAPLVRANTEQTKSIGLQVVPGGDGKGREDGLSKREKVATNARSGRPIFTGQRLVIHEWMLDDLMRMLGPHCDGFDLHEWFFVSDAVAAKESVVLADWWPWLKAQTLAEAKRRGLPIAVATLPVEQRLGKQSNRLMAAIANLSDERPA